MRSEPVRTVLVDDEEPARELLRALLVAWPEVVIVSEAGDGEAALAAIERDTPDLVFLDVRMPGLSGLDVAAALRPDATPLIVFVTAFEQYAVRAFELAACDYLLKPFDATRLAATMERVFMRLRSAYPAADLVRDLLRQVRPAPSPHVVVSVDGSHLFLEADDIEWIEAGGKTSHLHLLRGSTKGVISVRESIGSLERRLDSRTFVRVHRSAIVNRRQIREVQPWFKGDHVIVLRRGGRIVTGRTYREAVLRLIAGWEVGAGG
jgi:two-component system LytT family response regulator